MRNREFDYFLFENYDVATVSSTDNPRNFLNESADSVLSDIVNSGDSRCGYYEMCNQYTNRLINSLIKIGLLRVENNALWLDSTAIVREDIQSIKECSTAEISHLVDKLSEKKSDLYSCARLIENGFDEKINLYHLLCGAVFDGSFFGYLSSNQTLATSRLHPAGIDYIITIYEKCPELDNLSNHLLCSYNRFSDGSRALQSFGDADGNRIDFYRFNCQKMLGAIPPVLRHIEEIWDSANGNDRVHILNALQAFDETGNCDENCMRLFEAFGYIFDGKYVVPVFRQSAKNVVVRLTKIVIDCIGLDMRKLLSDSPVMSQLYCHHHGVPKEEVANEMYHILFGMMNEELVLREIVQNPNYIDGEGRYLKSIELYTN